MANAADPRHSRTADRRRRSAATRGGRAACGSWFVRQAPDQHTENQLAELRQYAQARGWTITREYVDHGISGAKERRPALDELTRDARRRRFDAVACWRLDGLGLKHLISLLEELQVLNVAFVSLAEGLDATTPAGKLQMHILGAIAEFERGRLRERVCAGLARAKAGGRKLGRPPHRVQARDLARTAQLSTRAAAGELGVSPSLIHKLRSQNLVDFRPQPNAETWGPESNPTTVTN